MSVEPGLTLGGVLDEEDVVRSERGVRGDAAPREDVFAHGFPSLAYDGLGLPGEDFPGKVRGGIGRVTLRGPTVHSRVRFGRADQQVRLLGRHHVVQHLGGTTRQRMLVVFRPALTGALGGIVDHCAPAGSEHAASARARIIHHPDERRGIVASSDPRAAKWRPRRSALYSFLTSSPGGVHAIAAQRRVDRSKRTSRAVTMTAAAAQRQRERWWTTSPTGARASTPSHPLEPDPPSSNAHISRLLLRSIPVTLNPTPHRRH